MRPPFPGMDPWLEHPEIWPGVHGSLIAAIRDDLASKVAPRYFVDIEERVYLVNFDEERYLGRPDVVVSGPGGTAFSTSRESRATSTVVDFVEQNVKVPKRFEEITLRRLAIRRATDQELVTVIELLSPTNKVDRKGRRQYREKRDAIFESRTNFVEIDLLRAGRPMPFEGGPALNDYRILIAREQAYPNLKLREFSVRQAIPPVPIPLLPGEEEPSLDLNAVLHGVYDRARYDLRIDYTRHSVPPLRGDDARWAATILASPPREV